MQNDPDAQWRQKLEGIEHLLLPTDSDPFLAASKPSWNTDDGRDYSSGATAVSTRQYHILFAVLAYICLAFFAWVTTCILSFHPVGLSSYIADTTETGFYIDMGRHYQKNERWSQAARVVQSIVSVLTIPLTSAVCAKAAVAFAQRSSHRTSLSLRQTMALADKGWASPALILPASTLHGFRRIGSSFLLLAIVINIVGRYCVTIIYEYQLT